MEYVTLQNGIKMPILGYGVYQVTQDECERCVLDALDVGYRSIDTAQSYFNEEQVGSAIQKSGLPREDIFLTTKVLEQLMEQRIIYARGESSLPDIPLSGRDGYRLVTAVPVITDGDVSGCVAFISEKEDTASSEVLLGLCQSAAQFLSRRIAV